MVVEALLEQTEDFIVDGYLPALVTLEAEQRDGGYRERLNKETRMFR